MIEWTDKQQEVLDARNKNVLVSAAAGSGKTAVLVERILRMIKDTENLVNIDEFLMVTFTRAAASEMKEKIRKRLIEESKNNPDNEHLRKQLSLIYGAEICTIDSFVNKVVSQNFEDLDIDPNFRVMDQVEDSMLIEDITAEVLDSVYEEADDEMMNLLRCFSKGRYKINLDKTIIDIIDMAQKQVFPYKWLEAIKGKNSFENIEELEKSDFMVTIANKIDKSFKTYYDNMLDNEFIAQEEMPEKEYDVYVIFRDYIKRIIEAKGYGNKRDIIVNIPRPKSPTKSKTKYSDELIDFVQITKDAESQLKKYYYDKKRGYAYMESLEEILESVNKSQKQADMLNDIATKVMHRLDEEKKKLAAYSFNDLARFAISILCNEENGVIGPTPKAVEMSKQYKEVIIDEYQDSNYVQENLLKAVTLGLGVNNMFMVGDVKQSIYGFRSAEPDLFLEKYNSFSSDEDADEQKIILDKNFRSREEIINSTNRIFDAIMQKDVGGIDYLDGNRLVYGANYYEEDVNTTGENNKTEVHMLHTDEKAKESKAIEAQFIAKRIKELMNPNTGLKITNKNRDNKNLSYRDIVILTSAPASVAEIYMRELENYNIPVFAERKNGFYESVEISTILSFLEVVNNPLQDIPLAVVLKSPIYRFSDDDLATMRIKSHKTLLYDDVVKYSNEGSNEVLKKKCADFVSELADYKKHSKYMSVYEFIEYFLEKTGYEYYARSLHGGKRRLLNIKMVKENAYNYENTCYRSLFNFVRFLKKNIDAEKTKGESIDVGEEDDVVRIISIHKSKGLEYPVVFLSNCTRNIRKNGDSIFIDKYGNMDVPIYDLDGRTFMPAKYSEIIQSRDKKKKTAEGIRLLYVAMTRAQEKLIISSTVNNNLDTYKSKLAFSNDVMSESEILDRNNYNQLICSVLYDEICGSIPQEIGEDEAVKNHVSCSDDIEFYFETATLDETKEMDNIEAETVDDGSDVTIDEIKQNFQSVYPYENLKDIKAKVSVTELKNRDKEVFVDEDAKFFITDTRTKIVPKFLQESQKEKLYGASLGTVYHKIFELLDMELEYSSISDATLMLNQLVSKGHLTEDERGSIDDSKIFNFTKSNVFARMKKAYDNKQLYREQKFLLSVDSDEIYNNGTHEDVVIQGIVDVCFIEDGEYVVVDYKTDKVESLDELVDKYKSQLNWYGKALTTATSIKTKEKIIYSVKLDDEKAF